MLAELLEWLDGLVGRLLDWLLPRFADGLAELSKAVGQ